MDEGTRRYEVLEVLGSGAFGSVYRASMMGSGGFAKPVAIKLLHEENVENDEIAKRFRDEARILGLIRHRAVVGADALVRLAGQWAVVMEYVEGIDLAKVLGRHGAVPLRSALEIAVEVTAALDVAYDKPNREGKPLRLLHRDIKPSNICLTAEGEVKILDFGIAKAVFSDREAETRAMMMGSRGYMAPERHIGESVHTGDVYAVAVMVWELVMGERFGRTSIDEDAHKKKLVKSKAKMRRRVSENEELEGLLYEGLAFMPDQRPNARDFKRRAAALLKTTEGPDLAEWCDTVVPKLLGARKVIKDKLCGQTLSEGDDKQPASEELPPEPEETEDAPRPDVLGLNPSSEYPAFRPTTPPVRSNKWIYAAFLAFGAALIIAVAISFAVGVWVAG